MYTLEEIVALRQKCTDYQLEGRGVLEKYTDEDLQKICNGIGPEGAPLFLRRMLTGIHGELEVAALIHDVDFRESDGREESFNESNDRFLANGIKVSQRYKWYDLHRYLLQLQARRLAAWCRTFGMFFWRMAAMNDRKEEF